MEPNIIGLILGGLAFFILGSLWYQNFSFGKAWQNALGFTEEYLKEGNAPLIFGSALIMMLIMVFGMVPIMHAHTDLTIMHGAFHGLMIGLFFIAPSMGINYLFQRRPLKLWFIDALYQVLGMALAGAIYAAF